MITGFGRTGEWFATGRFGLSPDLITVAKGITSGYIPLGGVIASARVAEPFWTAGTTNVFRHGYTYSGHATACAVALANLDVIEREDLVQRVRELEPVLTDALARSATIRRSPRCAADVGLLGAVELADPSKLQAVIDAAYARGVLVRGIRGVALQVSPPFVITEDELATTARCSATRSTRPPDGSGSSLFQRRDGCHNRPRRHGVPHPRPVRGAGRRAHRHAAEEEESRLARRAAPACGRGRLQRRADRGALGSEAAEDGPRGAAQLRLAAAQGARRRRDRDARARLPPAVDPEQLDLARFERLVAEARETETAEERAARLRERSRSGAEPPLADLAYEPFARPRSRGSRSSASRRGRT